MTRRHRNAIGYLMTTAAVLATILIVGELVIRTAYASGLADVLPDPRTNPDRFTDQAWSWLSAGQWQAAGLLAFVGVLAAIEWAGRRWDVGWIDRMAPYAAAALTVIMTQAGSLVVDGRLEPRGLLAVGWSLAILFLRSPLKRADQAPASGSPRIDLAWYDHVLKEHYTADVVADMTRKKTPGGAP